jgi:drug/metabolite transporter (DMT)-like permease
MNLNILLSYLIVCVVWGSTYLVIRVGVESFPSLWFAGIRFVAAGLIMYLFLLYRKIPIPRNWKDYLPIAWIGILLLTIGNGFLVWSEQWIDSGLAALICAALPIWMALFGLIFIRSLRPTLLMFLGISLGFIGMFILIYPRIGPVGSFSFKGIFGLLLGTMGWAIGTVLTFKYGSRYHALVLTTFEMLFGGIILVVCGLLFQHFHWQSVTLTAWYSLVYLIIIASCITLSAYSYLMSHAPPTWATTYAYINPVIAVFLGWLILQEPVNLNIMLGASIILTGVGIVNYEQFYRSKPSRIL